MKILMKILSVSCLALVFAVISLAQGEESRENVLLTGLRSSDVAVRRAAARDLVQTEHRNLGRILPTLLLALKDPDPTVRFYTVVTLEAAAYSSESNAMALNAGVASLTQMLRDKESRVREAAARAISLVMPHPPQSAAIPLTGLLNDPDPSVRKVAIGGLSRIEPLPSDALPMVVKALDHDPSPMVRGAAATLLGQVPAPTPEVIQVLIKGLNESDEFVKQQSVRAVEGLLRSLAGCHCSDAVSK